MGFSDILDKIKERSRNRKEMMREMDEKMRVEELLMERRKSANQRELESYMKEKNEENIKFELDKMRKMREQDVRFNHNPLNVKNITSHTDWEVLKEKNLFNKMGNMFANQPLIHKNNPKLLKNAKWLMN